MKTLMQGLAVLGAAVMGLYVPRAEAAGVLAWGRNELGQCDVPAEAKTGVTAIAAGWLNTVALKDGKVIAWGNTNFDQCNVPVEAQTGVTAIAAGNNHIVALKGGKVIAWGNNGNHQCEVPAEAQTGVTAIAAGGYFTAALKDGKVILWGYTTGLGTVPEEAQTGVTAISAGGWSLTGGITARHMLALKGGKVIAWGYTNAGQCDVPVEAQTGVTAISAGGAHSVALKDGKVIAWGNNGDGQSTVPAEAQTGVTAIAARFWHTVALKGGKVIVWGGNFTGECTVPAEAQSGMIAIAAGAGFTMALGTAAAVPQNLLVNPGAETKNTMGWTDPDGAWMGIFDYSYPKPHGGVSFFWPGVIGMPHTTMYQDVNVSSQAAGIDAGLVYLHLSGWLDVWDYSPYDQATLGIQALNSSAQQLLCVSRSHRSPVWTRYAMDAQIPSGTRTLRVALTSTRFSGDDNDGYFDDLSLTVDTNPPTAFVTIAPAGGQSLVEVGRTLQLTATTTGGVDSNYTWQSSFKEVATVAANGLVTALRPGRFFAQAEGVSTHAIGDIELVAYRTNSLIVTQPASGAACESGSLRTIEWNMIGSVPAGTLYYSINGGAAWTLVASIPGLGVGHHDWTVPSTDRPLNSCVIKMTWADGEGVSGIFSILPSTGTNHTDVSTIHVTPGSWDFGIVQVGTSAEADFTVSNIGAGTLDGTATVVGPFSILSGGVYSIATGVVHTVRVRYSPIADGMHSSPVMFTGGGGTNSTVTGRAIGNGDSDGDGTTDWEEHVAGTSATNRNEYLRITDCKLLPSRDGAVIWWNSVTGRWYTVQRSTDNLVSWTNVYGTAGDGGTRSYTNRAVASPPVFLRLGVELQK